MVEWLSQHIIHRAFVNDGRAAKSTGLTFREQEEVEKKKKVKAKKKKVKKQKA